MISVIICTYNRADLLADVLQTVCEQSLERSEYEIIIIDNNSTDETPTIGQSFVALYPNVRCFVEMKQGLSHARNRGWQEARGEYVAYIDDDCKVPPKWLACADTIISEHAPDILGGPYFAFYNRPKPVWYKDVYGSYTPFPSATWLEQPDVLHGGNLFLRRELIAEIDGFNPELGMHGKQIAYGEEAALLCQLLSTVRNLRAYYDPELWVYHLVRPEKMSWRWIIRDAFIRGQYTYQVYPDEKFRLTLFLRRIVMSGLWFVASIPYGFLLRNHEQYPYVQNFWYESGMRRVQELGEMFEKFRQKYNL